MTRTNTRDDLFDGVEIPRKPEPEAAKPDTTTANARSRTRSRRDTQPDGVPAARLATWAGSLLGAVLIVIAWSISVWHRVVTLPRWRGVQRGRRRAGCRGYIGRAHV